MRAMAWVLLLTACGTGTGAEDTGLPPGGDVDYGASGPYEAGTARVVVTNADGLSLPVQIWYPATGPGAATVRYDGLTPGDAYEGVPADCEAPRPVAAFSHGYAGIRYQSAFLTEHLASHGWVVVAPDHVGNTFTDALPDLVELVVRRPLDLADAVDWLFDAANDAGSPYHGCASDDGGYAVMGHSFGGYTALAAAGASVNTLGGGTAQLGDPRVRATVALAPWDGFGALTDGTRAIDVPTLVLTGARDQVTPLAMVRSLWDPMTVQPRFLGVFPDGGHYSFSPVACMLMTGDGCGAGYLDLDILTLRVNEAVLSFLESGAPPLDAPELEWESSG